MSQLTFIKCNLEVSKPYWWPHHLYPQVCRHVVWPPGPGHPSECCHEISECLKMILNLLLLLLFTNNQVLVFNLYFLFMVRGKKGRQAWEALSCPLPTVAMLNKSCSLLTYHPLCLLPTCCLASALHGFFSFNCARVYVLCLHFYERWAPCVFPLGVGQQSKTSFVVVA